MITMCFVWLMRKIVGKERKKKANFIYCLFKIVLFGIVGWVGLGIKWIGWLMVFNLFLNG